MTDFEGRKSAPSFDVRLRADKTATIAFKGEIDAAMRRKLAATLTEICWSENIRRFIFDCRQAELPGSGADQINSLRTLTEVDFLPYAKFAILPPTHHQTNALQDRPASPTARLKSEITFLEGHTGTIDNLLIFDGAKEGQIRPLASQNPQFNILLVEDNKTNQLIIQSILSTLNIPDPTIANDGNEAIRAIQENAYDLVLMDISMPNLDGYQATTEIRKLPGNAAQIPIIAVTANVTHAERQKCFEVGMNDFIPKPVNLTTLTDTLMLYMA